MDMTQELPDAPPTDFEEIPTPEADAAPSEPQAPELFHETREGKLLSDLIDNLEQPDETVRELMVRVWKKMENYWRDRQYIIWDEIASDWRTPEEIKLDDKSLDIDPAAYAKIINIYKAHGQAIISALSAGLPFVRFFPDDADSQDDIFTAKSYSKLAELIQKRNKGQLLFIRALFLLYNCGTVFAYNENRDTDQFGTLEKPKYEDVPVVNRQQFCPSCGLMLGSEQHDVPPPPDLTQPPTEMPAPDAQTVQPANGIPEPPPQSCPQCGNTVNPDYEDYHDVIPRLVGYTQEPKSHECIEIFSGLHVKVPHWVTSQEQTPYLSLETEEHVALLRDIYSEVAELIAPSGDDTTYDRQARRNSDYRGDTPRDLMTLKRAWIRPWAFNQLGTKGEAKDDVEYLKSLYPEGVYISKVGDLIVEAVPDRLDDHWTITRDPLSNHLHSDPLAQSLVSVQDIQNEVTNLTLETIEFGIPETFYDSDAIDADQYGKSEARPGMLYPIKPRPTMGVDSSFHTIKTSTLSQEVDNFADRITQAGQFVSGAMPTIWGGALEGSGGTAKEVENARAMSLQRLNLTWNMVKVWWADVMSKSVRSFASNMKDDEKFVQAKGTSFINVWIRKAEMTGKIGSVEPDVNEAFPISWAQKRDILMGLINLKNPLADAVIAHPENAGIVAATLGFPELYIPGDDARNKQLWEISQLIMAQPTPTGMPDPTHPGQEVLQPTIPVEDWEDNHTEAETCKAWLMSEVGIDAKQNNPGGYMNVVAHWRMHDFKLKQEQAAQMPPPDQENKNAQPPQANGN
jgi:hypothetical protein